MFMMCSTRKIAIWKVRILRPLYDSAPAAAPSKRAAPSPLLRVTAGQPLPMKIEAYS
jgi:hypothetical protein